VEQQAAAPQFAPEQAVVAAVAVGGVADDGVKDVLQVAADLVPPPGAGSDLQQRVAGRGEGPDGKRQFRRGQAPEGGNRFLGDVSAAPPFLKTFRNLPQRVVDDGFFAGDAPHDCQVGLADPPLLESVGGAGGRFRRKGEQQHARGGAIQTVHRIDTATCQGPRQLQGEYRFMPVQVAAVHEHAGGLVDRQEMVVPVKDGKLDVHDE